MSVLGKLPSRMDFVHCGVVDEPELVLRSWLERAVMIAGGVLPNRAVRFVVAPRRTPMLGVWIPSHDALGRSFPLVFLRRLSSSLDTERTTGSVALGDLPWTLILAGCSHYLSAAESCLMLGRASSAASVWAKLETLPLPNPRDLTELCSEANRVMESERLEAFAARNLGVGASDAEFLSALRRLGPPVRERACGDSAVRDGDSMLGLPAANEFDMFAWLELLRAQRAAGATPRSLFWSPADRRALVSLGAPLPGTLAFLRQPPVRSVQRLPVVNEPDESPAIEHELCRLVRRCVTLSKLRAALSGDRKEAGRPPPLPEKEPKAPTKSPDPPAAPQPREPHSDSEPPPLRKFVDGPAPRSHFAPATQPPDTQNNHVQEQQPSPRPTDVPRTEPLSDSFKPEAPEDKPAPAASLEGIRFRIPDPPINLSDTDAIEYICALVRERERADEERKRAAQRRERIANQDADDDREPTERAQRPRKPFANEDTDDREPMERAQPRRERTGNEGAYDNKDLSERAEQRRERIANEDTEAHKELGARAARWRARIAAKESAEEVERAQRLRRAESERIANPPEHSRASVETINAGDDTSRSDRANADLVLEHVVERERSFSRREQALSEREREVRRRELALQSRERQLRERARAVRHDERARRISQTVTIAERAPASVRVLEPITVIHGPSHTAAPARSEPAAATCHTLEPTTTIQPARQRWRGREPVTVVDDGSIRAARVLMIE